MKVIDTHTHLPGRLFGGEPMSASDLRATFETEGLSGAWLMTVDGLLLDAERNNDILAEAVRPHRDFFVPFCSVNPHRGIDAAVRELQRCRRDLDMRGLKLHPWLQSFSHSHPALIPILKAAGELSMPVLFHDGSPPYSSPLQIAAAAEKVPETTVILGHAGLEDLYEDAILACLRHPNIHLCLCSLSTGPIKTAIARCPADRLLFGTDGGCLPDLIAPALTKFRCTGASEEVARRILYENPMKLLPFVPRGT